jgi:tRNA uridine 5-carbamoylmethylation protein Kti12
MAIVEREYIDTYRRSKIIILLAAFAPLCLFKNACMLNCILKRNEEKEMEMGATVLG